MILTLSNCRIEKLPNGDIQIVREARWSTAYNGRSGVSEGDPVKVEPRELPKLIEFLQEVER